MFPIRKVPIMRNNPMADGWKRFLDRLKQLWGRFGDGAFARRPAAAFLGHGLALHV